MNLGYRCWLGVLALVAGSAWATATDWLQIDSAGLLLTRAGEAELGTTLRNPREHSIWVLVHFQTPGGVENCLHTREVMAGSEALFLCRQREIVAGEVYTVAIQVFSDASLENLQAELAPQLRFSPEDVIALGRSAPALPAPPDLSPRLSRP